MDVVLLAIQVRRFDDVEIDQNKFSDSDAAKAMAMADPRPPNPAIPTTDVLIF